MRDQTLLTSFLANLNANVFLREFSFARTCFTPPGGTELELADHVVRVGNLLLLYQLKERDAAATGSLEVWIKNKVVRKATRQIRSTVALLSSGSAVTVANERGHTFDLKSSAERRTSSHRRVQVWRDENSASLSSVSREWISWLYPHLRRERLLEICRYLVTPAEIAEYLDWRQRSLEALDAAPVSEAALLGQYMLDDASRPDERFANALIALRNDAAGFDMSFIFANLADHIESASATERGQNTIRFCRCWPE